MVHFSNLTRLKFENYNRWDEKQDSDRDTGRDLKALVIKQPQLVTLDLSYWSSADADFWEAVAEHLSLKSLLLDEMSFYQNAKDSFWRACSRMKRLHLNLVVVKDNLPDWDAYSFLSLRVLKIVSDKECEFPLMQQLALVERCLNLDELTWHPAPRSDYRPMLNRFAELVAAKPHLGLKKLSWGYGYPYPFMRKDPVKDDDLMATIVTKMKRISQLDILRTLCGPKSLQAVMLHHDTLTELRLPGRSFVTSPILIEILCACPKLQVLQGSCVRAQDIVTSSRPWACRGLKELSFMLLFYRREDHLQPSVFERLAGLRHLEILWPTSIDSRGYDDEIKPRGLDFRLEFGLGKLADLKRLRRVSLSDSPEVPRLEDVKWMLERWPDLCFVEGRSFADKELEARIEKEFAKHGVDTWFY